MNGSLSLLLQPGPLRRVVPAPEAWHCRHGMELHYQLQIRWSIAWSTGSNGWHCNTFSFTVTLSLPRNELNLAHRTRLLAKVLLPCRLQLVPRTKARRLELLRQSCTAGGRGLCAVSKQEGRTGVQRQAGREAGAVGGDCSLLPLTQHATAAAKHHPVDRLHGAHLLRPALA